MSAKKLISQALVVCQLFVLLHTARVESVPQDLYKTPDTIFSNPTSIAINSASVSSAPFPATLYPSNVDVSGMTGNISRVAVTLNGFNHSRSGDLDFLLVSPTGAKFIFLSDFNYGPMIDKVLTFADDAAGPLGTNVSDVSSGSYKPTSGDSLTDTFPAPAPTGPYSLPPASTFASVFNGVSPNGSWSLFAVDDLLGDSGTVNGGWSLTITTDGSPSTFKNAAVIGLNDVTTPADPYGTAISVTGQTGVISSLKVGFTGLTHPRLDDIDILLVSPNGKGVVIMSDAGFGSAVNNVNFTFDDSSGTIPSNPTSGTYRPTDISDTTTGIDPFPHPAPIRPYHAFTGPNSLSNFNGFSPNGEWRLFVLDDSAGNSGSISGGWFLDITTAPVVPPMGPACAVPSFASPTNFAAGNIPTNLALADFNNDMKADIAVTNQVSNDVSILLGTGTGAFMPQTLIAAGSSPYAVAAGKFNADNNFDLAVVNSGSNNVSIFLGNGNGTFSAATNFLVGSSPISVAVGDLDNDGKQDLAVANFGSFFAGSVSILLGNGTGGFTQGIGVRTRSQPSFVAIANLNSTDANLDLVVTSFGSNSVTTFFGNGTGTFVVGQNLSTNSGPVSVEVADLDPDGRMDFVVANYDGDSITTCKGTNTTGTFSCSSNSVGGPNPISVAADDYLGSGSKVPAVALSGSNIVKVGVSNVNVGANPNAVESADLNGDGRIDLISVNSGSNDVSVALNSCAVAVGNIFDWNGDRRTDYTVFRSSSQAWYNSSLNSTNVARYFARPNYTLVPADYDADGKTDYGLFRPESGLWIVHDGQNARPLYNLQFGIAEDIPTPADFDGDGKADLAVFRPSDGNWYVRRTSDNSTQVFPFGATGDKPVAADFDGDGRADFAVFRPSTGVWYISRSSDGQATIIQFGISEDKTVVGDYDGDRKADIAVWRPSTGVWWIRWSSDGGTRAFVWGAPGDFPVPGDYDSDGKYDLAIWRPSDRTWYVMKSSDGGFNYFQWGLATDYPIPSAYVR